jgi:transcription termination factor Rho
MTNQPEALDRGMLERKARDELQRIASAVGATVGARAKKSDIVDAILAAAGIGSGGADSPASSDESTPELFDSTASPSVEAAEQSASGQPVANQPASNQPAAGQGSSGDGVTRRRVRTATSVSAEPTPAADRTKPEPAADPASNRQPQPNANSAQGAGRRSGNPNAQSNAGAPAKDSDTSSSEPNESGTSHQNVSNGGSNGSGADGTGDEFDSNSKRKRRRRGRDRGGEEQLLGDPVEVTGLVDLRDDGYGFLRTNGFLASRDDSYLPTKLVRQYGLRNGDLVSGSSRPSARGEKNPALLSVELVNGLDPEQARNRPDFDDLTPLFPDSKLRLESGRERYNATARIIDLIAPIGKGQRGLIVAPPKAGKTTIVKRIAQAIEKNHPEVELIMLLVDERPEEVTDMRRSISGTVVASTFDRPADEHTQVAELVLERAKRLVEEGKDVVIILDGITRLARAYNLAAPGTGRIMSGGIDSGALYPPKKFFGAARNVEEGGSLTILATALVETGSKMDEVIFEEFKGTGNMELRLDRRLAERRVYPAIDVDGSGTRHEELLFDRRQLDQVWKLRRVLSGLAGDSDSRTGAGLELLVDRLQSFKTNDDFLAEIAGSTSL